MISIVILTFNSARYLDEVLDSTDWANEVVLVDSKSSDDTLKIAKKHANVRILEQEWLGFGRQKQAGVDAAKNDWIFVLDSDEVMNEALSKEIISAIKSDKFKAFKVARLNYFFGKPVLNMGLYPDFSVRLFDRNYAKFSDDEVHERVLSSAPVGELKEHFTHYAYEDLEQFIAKQNRYSSLSASRKKRSKFKALFSPMWTFFRLFVLRGGWREGWRGYVIARLYAQYSFWKYVK